MNGQMSSFEEKKKIVDNYLAQTDVYKPLVSLKFDLRGYADYVEKNNIDSRDVTDDILEMFVKA